MSLIRLWARALLALSLEHRAWLELAVHFALIEQPGRSLVTPVRHVRPLQATARRWTTGAVQTTNCSLRIRSSRLCSGSNSRVTVCVRDSWMVTSTTSRTSCESAVTLTGRL